MILVNIFQIFGEASAQEAFEEFVGKKKLLNLRIISYDMEFLINEKINSIYLLERDSAKKNPLLVVKCDVKCLNHNRSGNTI